MTFIWNLSPDILRQQQEPTSTAAVAHVGWRWDKIQLFVINHWLNSQRSLVTESELDSKRSQMFTKQWVNLRLRTETRTTTSWWDCAKQDASHSKVNDTKILRFPCELLNDNEAMQCVTSFMNMEKMVALVAEQTKPVMWLPEKIWNSNAELDNDENRHLAIARYRQPSAQRWYRSWIVAENWRLTFTGVILFWNFKQKQGKA